MNRLLTLILIASVLALTGCPDDSEPSGEDAVDTTPDPTQDVTTDTAGSDVPEGDVDLPPEETGPDPEPDVTPDATPDVGPPPDDTP